MKRMLLLTLIMVVPLFAQDNQDIWDKALDEIERKDPASFKLPEIFVTWLKGEGYKIPQVNKCFQHVDKDETHYANVIKGNIYGENSEDWAVMASRVNTSRIVSFKENSDKGEIISVEFEERNCIQEVGSICFTCYIELIPSDELKRFAEQEYLKESNTEEVLNIIKNADHDAIYNGMMDTPGYLLYYHIGEWIKIFENYSNWD